MFFAAGCAVNRVEKDYENSTRLVKLNQILTPDAAKNLEPVYGFDGYAAEATIKDRYRESFKTQNAAGFPMSGFPSAAGAH